MYIYIYVIICIHICKHIHTYKYIYIYIYIYTHTYTHIHIHIYKHIHITHIAFEVRSDGLQPSCLPLVCSLWFGILLPSLLVLISLLALRINVIMHYG